VRRQRRSQFELRSYAGADLYERVLREAAARRLSISECVRTDLSEYYAIRDELTECVHVHESEPDGEPRKRIVHTLLAEMETRLVAGLDRQGAIFEESLNVLAWMIERSYLGLILHLPEVREGESDQRARSARLRHAAWKKEVRRCIEMDGPAISALLTEQGSDSPKGPDSTT